MDEPDFSVAYAKMCDVLREKKVPKQDGSGGPVDFRKLLVTRCQKEFERDYMEGYDKTKYETEYAAATNDEDRKQLKLKFELQERRARKRSLGNIRFIGELYNLKMLTDRIMHEIINKLIHQVDEESLECLCWLFNTIGKTLEQATNAKLSAPANDEAKKTVSCYLFYFSYLNFLKLHVTPRLLKVKLFNYRILISLIVKKFEFPAQRLGKQNSNIWTIKENYIR